MASNGRVVKQVVRDGRTVRKPGVKLASDYFTFHPYQPLMLTRPVGGFAGKASAAVRGENAGTTNKT